MKNSATGGSSASVKMPSAGASGSNASKRRGSESTGAAAAASTDSANGATAALSAKMKAESLRNDTEAFYAAFSVPTQVYRTMRNRMIYSPFLLQRNLSYMKHRMSRNHKARKTFKVDDILMKVKTKLEMEQREKNPEINFYNVVFLGFYDPTHNWLPDTKAKVEIQIARICLKKRKEMKAPVVKAFEGSSEVKILTNYTPLTEPVKTPTKGNKCSAVSIPSDCFNLINGHVVRSYELMVRVSVPRSALVKVGSGSSIPFSPASSGHRNSENGNGNLISPSKLSTQLLQVSQRGQPSVALQRIQRPTSGSLGSELNKVIKQEEDSSSEPKQKRRRSVPAARNSDQFIYGNISGSGNSPSSDGPENYVVFMGHTKIYDKQMSIGLGNEDYEVFMNETFKRRSSFNLSRLAKKEPNREVLDSLRFEECQAIGNHPKLKLEMGTEGYARLKFSIRTSTTELDRMVDHPQPVYPLSSTNGGYGVDGDEKPGAPALKVVYQFILTNNSSRQMTEARDDLRCPWCSLNCFTLYSLLKHLKLSHMRFNFIYVPQPNGARIDVSLNQAYDGSYAGSAFDLVAQPPGEAFARNGPTKRTKVFNLIVCHPEKLKPSLQEFLENDDKDSDQRRSYIIGHNRLYHHTTTCLPIHPKEIDVDSEGEPDPEWMQVKTSMMIDEFTDVNEGEKELMKMWNLHVLKHNYVGDCQIPLACEKFVEYQGRELIRKNLYRNFVLHLTNLFDFGLLSPHGMYLVMNALHTQIKETNTASSLRDSWKAHMHSQIPESSISLKQDAPPSSVPELDHKVPTIKANQSTAAVKKPILTANKTSA